MSTSSLGTDISCIDDFDAGMSLVSGTVMLGQALLRRLTTPAGGLWYDAEYGYDVRELVESSHDRASLARAEARIVAQCRLDERVDAVRARLALVQDSLRLELDVECAEGPFRLVCDVTTAAVRLQSQG